MVWLGMDKQYTSLCSRCGSERIVAKRWVETIGVSEVQCTLKVCSNVECQRIVDKEIKQQKDRKEAMERKKAERYLAKKAEQDAIAVSKKPRKHTSR